MAWRWLFVWVAIASRGGCQEAAEIALFPGHVVRLATVEEGRAEAQQRDRFTDLLSRFDRQCRLATDRDATLDEVLRHYAAQVEAFDADDERRVQKLLGEIAPRLAELRVPLPERVLFVKTTGRDEAGAAYTRGTTVYFPRPLLRDSDEKLRRLIAHELFHVISRHASAFRRQAYAAIGFRVCPEWDLPPALRDRRITNPDAPAFDCVIELRDGDRTLHAGPVLYASSDYAPEPRRTLFQYLTFRLLELEPLGEGWQPRLVDGQPVLWDPKQKDRPPVASFHEQIGANTGYIIHPDEILADNFALMVVGVTNWKTPAIPERLKRVLIERMP